MTDIKRCATCKHWESRSPSDEWASCGFVLDTNEEHKDPHSERAHPEDTEGWHAWFSTRSDFGCIEHDPREATP